MPKDWEQPKKKKQNKKLKKAKKDEDTSKKVSDLNASDFLLNTPKNKLIIDRYVFSDGDADDFEDSNEELEPSEGLEFFTPKNFKSIFAARLDSKRKCSPDESERNIRQRSQSVGTKIPMLTIRPVIVPEHETNL